MPKIHWSGWKWKKFSWICWWVRWVSGMLYELEHWIKQKYLFQKWNIHLQQIQHSLKYRHKMRSAIVTFTTTTVVLVTKSYIFPMPFIPGFFGSVAQSCPTLCDPMNRSTPGLPVHHQLLEFTQTPVRWVGVAIQPSHPLSSPSPPALNLSQHQGLFQWVSSSHQVAKVLEFQLQIQSFQWTPSTDL